MKRHYHYIGCFVSAEELFRHISSVSTGHLERVIEIPHVTFAYKPEEVDEKLFGEKILVRAVGYANDGENEGIRVEIFSENAQISKMAEQIPVPHITLSVSDSGQPVNTCFLRFCPITPFEMEGVFGGCDEEGNIIIESI